jgi:hypothetical protein
MKQFGNRFSRDRPLLESRYPLSNVFRYTQCMQITLTPHAEELLRSLLARQPGRSPAEIVEQALAGIEHQSASSPERLPAPKRLSHKEFQASLDRMAQFSNKIPPMPRETFSREMIYQDHD